MSMYCVRQFLLITFAYILVGCGGDGGDGDPFANLPVASCQVTPDSNNPTQATPLQIELDGSLSSSPAGNIIEYRWDLGNGDIVNGSKISYTYNFPGTYTVSLTVKDEANEAARCQLSPITVAGHSVQGTIFIAPNTRVDSDINDPNALAEFFSNDSFASAQTIPNPVVVGGFVSATATNFAGDNFEKSADKADIYKISLTQGQTITLSIAENYKSASTPDFDLFLYQNDNTQTLVDSATQSGRLKTLTVAETGNYFLEVRAVRGIANYSLNIGLSTISTQNQTQPLAFSPTGPENMNFIPNEIIVRHKQQSPTDGRAIASTEFQRQMSKIGLIKKASNRQTSLYGLGDENNKNLIMSRMNISSLTQGRSVTTNRDLIDKQETLKIIQQLKLRDDILYAEPNYIRKPLFTPNDEYFNLQWHYNQINLPQAWKFVPDTSSVTIAVIDTGVVTTHPDLQENLLDNGYDFIRDPEISNDGDGIDSNPDDAGDSPNLSNSSFHGTHVAGTIAAVTNNGQGVAGVAWNSKVIPIRALGVGGGTVYDIVQSLRYAAGLNNDSNQIIDKPADIINLSLGSGSFSQFEADTIAEILALDIAIVAAAGNDNSSTPSYPASHDGVISVAAVGASKEKAPYSNSGIHIDIAAPGGNIGVDYDSDGYNDGILSTWADDSSGTIEAEFIFFEGTSMAAPHVAGVIALMKGIYPDLSNNELNSLLISGKLTEDLGNDGPNQRNDIFGYGLIDAVKAVEQASLLSTGQPLPTVLLTTPSALAFGFTDTTLNLDIIKLGDDPITVNAAPPSVPWLEIVELEQATSGDNVVKSYQVQVNRDSLDNGPYQSSVIIQNNLGEDLVVVPVSLNVGEPSTLSNAGIHYIILLDQQQEAIAGTHASVENGVYQFSIDIGSDNYFLIAGTDLDNDGYICGAGEACGGYPVRSKLELINISEEKDQYEFLTQFIGGFNASSSTLPHANFKGFAIPSKVNRANTKTSKKTRL